MRANRTTDERVRMVKHQATNYGFGILLIGSILILLRRQLILNQNPAEYSDIIMVMALASGVATIYSILNGSPTFDSSRLKGRWITIPLITSTAILLTGIWQGYANTMLSAVSMFVLAYIGCSVALLGFNYLYRRWESKI